MAVEPLTVDVPVLMQRQFQQSKSYVNQEEPQIQFMVRVLNIPGATQRWVRTVHTVQKTGEIPQLHGFLVDVPAIMQRR